MYQTCAYLRCIYPCIACCDKCRGKEKHRYPQFVIKLWICFVYPFVGARKLESKVSHCRSQLCLYGHINIYCTECLGFCVVFRCVSPQNILRKDNLQLQFLTMELNLITNKENVICKE